MSTTAEYLEKLYEVRNSGILTLTIDGQTITYRSLKELNDAIAMLEKPGRTQKRVYYPKFARAESSDE